MKGMKYTNMGGQRWIEDMGGRVAKSKIGEINQTVVCDVFEENRKKKRAESGEMGALLSLHMYM